MKKKKYFTLDSIATTYSNEHITQQLKWTDSVWMKLVSCDGGWKWAIYEKKKRERKWIKDEWIDFEWWIEKRRYLPYSRAFGCCNLKCAKCTLEIPHYHGKCVKWIKYNNNQNDRKKKRMCEKMKRGRKRERYRKYLCFPRKVAKANPN